MAGDWRDGECRFRLIPIRSSSGKHLPHHRYHQSGIPNIDTLCVMSEEDSSQLVSGYVEIWFKIQKDEEGYPRSQSWEELWGTPVGGGGFRLESTPFFVKGIALGDVVAAERTQEGRYKFERIISRSGNSNFRIWLDDTKAQDACNIAQEIRKFGCKVEITLERLIAIDVSADREAEVWEYLEVGRANNWWEVQVGFSPD